MRCTSCCLTLLAVLGLTVAPANAGKNWQPLFNGDDLTGWQGVGGKPESWQVADGILRCTGRTKSEARWIATRQEYGDFELSLEVRLSPGANSGVFIRTPAVNGRPAFQGMEIQLIDADHPEYRNRKKPLRDTQLMGAIYDVVAPKRGAAGKPGQWQKLVIRCAGRHVRVTLNGHVVLDADLNDYRDRFEEHPGLKRASGRIGLQNHGDPVAFRNIRIRRIDNNDEPPAHENALLYRKLPIPERFLVTRDGHTFGGDVRIGDLDGDERCDFLVYRCNHGAPRGAHRGGLKPSFLGAFDMKGEPLWRAGEGGNHPSRPMSVAVREMTGDGAADIICFWHRPRPEIEADWQSLADVVVQIRDGRTGRVLREAAPPAITQRRRKDPVGANWVHQRLLVANFRGTEEPRDIAVKLGDTYVALNERLEVLWTYTSRWIRYSHCPAYIPAVGDLDGDGRDELNGGYFVLDDHGKPLWEKKLGRNMDSVAIAPWDDGRLRAVCSGYGHVMDAGGNAILALGKDEVPHGQEVRVADFRDDLPGSEMVLRNKGHKPDVLLVSSASNAIVDRFRLNASPTNVGMEPVYWNGNKQAALLYNGGWLWDLESRQGYELPDLPPPNGNAVHRMGFYHAIPANLCGDEREELTLWDPTAQHVFIYTPGPLNEAAYDRYRAGPRQYNPRLMD